MSQKLISIVIPVYNEEKNIPLVYDGLKKILRQINYEHEIIYINDGSSDNSGEEIDKLGVIDNKVKIIQFSRNFGKEMATTAGINYCQGDACILIDADLQHPLECIPEFVNKWENGAEIVVGIRQSNKSNNILKKFGSYSFYKIMAKISEMEIIPNTTDYRLLDRVVISEFNRFTEKNRMTRGLIDWLGFNKDFVYFNANTRVNGKAKYSTLKLIKLALSSFVSLSLFPLKLAGYVGIILMATTGLLGLFIFIEKYLLHDILNLNFSGPALLIIFVLFFVGVVLSCLGLVALYIANIHAEVTNRPLYVIRNKKKIN